MKITYLGHSAMLVEGDGKTIIIDPFITGNPKATVKAEDLKVDLIICTHGHSDHTGDAVGLSKANKCPVVAVFELASILAGKGAETIGMNTGGAMSWNGVHIKFTQAFHSSSYDDDGKIIYAGQPNGVILTLGGKTLYHTGDTALFSDMKMIGERNSIDVVALPIGDFYTMGPDDALEAASWIGAKHVIPIHYNTFPPIQQDAKAFAEQLHKRGMVGHPIQPGESVEI